ncbi:hypothetical protein, partial [Enterobacter intestinihominis]
PVNGTIQPAPPPPGGIGWVVDNLNLHPPVIANYKGDFRCHKHPLQPPILKTVSPRVNVKKIHEKNPLSLIKKSQPTPLIAKFGIPFCA